MERLLVPPDEGREKNLRRALELGWSHSPIRIQVNDCQAIEAFSPVSAVDAIAAVAEAIECWNRSQVGVELIITSDTEADVEIDWLFESDDRERLLGPSIQAHADYPPGNSLFGPPPIPIHFNANALWGRGEPGHYDIQTIAMHELGHALGLVYHSGLQTIMYDAIGPAPAFVWRELDPETIARTRRLYSRRP